jgi:MFS family permease
VSETTAEPARAPRVKAPSLWRHRDFLKLWSAETISQLGTQVTFLALPFIAIQILRVSPFAAALLQTFEFLPFILISIPAGVWVDRMRRRPILVIGDLGRGLTLLSIPIAYMLDALTIYQLWAVAFINGILTVFFDVAYQSYLPSLVERSQLVDGNGKLDTSRSGAQLFGPGLAGYVINILTAPIAILADSISYFASAAFVFGIRKHEPEPEPHPSGERPSMRREAMEGLRYVVGHPYLRWIATCTGTSNFFGNVLFSILLFYAFRDLDMSETTVGLIFSLGASGFLLGALIANRIARLLGVGRTILASTVVFGASGLFFAAAPPDLAFPLFVAGAFLGGLGGVVYNINQVSLRQAITPHRLQGRMNASMRFIVWGTIPVGQIVGGALGTAFGRPAALWVGAIGGLIAFLPILVSTVPGIKEMPEPVDDEPVAPVSPEVAAGAVPPFPPAPDAAAGNPTQEEPGDDHR